MSYDEGQYEKHFKDLLRADFNNLPNVDVTNLVLALPSTMRSFKSYEIGITKDTLEKLTTKLATWN